MRTKSKREIVKVSESVHERLLKDRDEFEKTIGGGKWSLSDTINEYHKILDAMVKKK